MAAEKNVVLAGYLIKSPPQEKLVAQWHRRYFVLWTSKIMEYYSSHEKKPQDYLKSIDLNCCEDMIAPLPVPGRPHVIKLSIKMGTKLRDYYLDCSNEDTMNSWVTALAKTCGFCPVDEDDDEKFYDSAELIREPTPPLPLEPPPTTSSSSIQSYLRDKTPPQSVIRAGPGRVPLLNPFNNIKPWLSQNDVSSMSRNDLDNNYHFLENGGSSTSSTMERNGDQGFAQGFYDLGVDDQTLYDMNKNPPPVWKPEDQDSSNPPPLPPTNRRLFNPDIGPSKLRLNIRPPIASQQTPSHSRPIPPPKPRPDMSVSATLSSGMHPGVLLSFKDDPKFNRKLEEKRQEIYGAKESIFRGRSISLNKVDDISQECYESIDTPSLQQPHPVLRVASLEYDYADHNSEGREEFLEFDSFSSSGHNSRASSLPPELPPKTDSLQQEVMVVKKTPLLAPHLPSRANRMDLTPVSELDVVPPPLPSRELIDPTREPLLPINLRPPIKTSPPSDDDAPPVPIRISSNRSAPILTSTHEHAAQQRQSLSAKSSPSRSPGSRSPSGLQMQPPHFSISQLRPANSPVAQRKARNNLSNGRTPSPPEVEVFQASDFYDDIQPVQSKTEVKVSQNSSAYDDIEYLAEGTGHIKPVSREVKARSLADVLTSREKEFTGTYDDIVKPNGLQSKDNATEEVAPSQNNLVSDALLNSLEIKLQAKKRDSVNPIPPPVKPKSFLNNNPKPRRFHAPPTKPKPKKASGPPENEGTTLPESPTSVLSDPGTNMRVGKHNHLSSLSFAQGKPTVPSKPLVASEKSPVAAKPTVSAKPHLNNRPVLPVPRHNQTDEIRGGLNSPRSSAGGEKPAALEKPKTASGPTPAKPKVAQKPIAEEHVSSQFRANPLPPSPAAAAIANALTNKSAPVPTQPKTGPPVAARNGILPGKTGPLLPTTARTGLTLVTESKTAWSTSPGKTCPPVMHPKPPKPDNSSQQPLPLPGVTSHEPWQRPPAIIPPTSKPPPPIRPKPT